jgi:2-(1,2-epoxy-1,2-dihydrophenyl)acetyl-CoA isomerase
MSETVNYQVDSSGVAVITLNRPESLNAMTQELLNNLIEIGQEAAVDPDVRSVVLTGAGRAFCAGGDVKAMSQDGSGTRGHSNALARVEDLRRQMDISRLLYEMPKPTIAAVNGAAAGAGLSIAMAADLRIASDQARFGTAFARVGFSGDFGGSWLMQRLLGPARAKELYFTAEMLDATRAYEIGLVNRVVAHDSLMDEVMALATKLANGPTVAFARMKENFALGATSTLAELLDREAFNHTLCGFTEDHREAARAFVEKREPEFRGV